MGRDFLLKMGGIIQRPSTTLKEIKGREPSISSAFALVGLLGVTSGLTSIFSVWKLLGILEVSPSEIGLELPSAFIYQFLGALIFAFSVWFTVAGFFHLLAKMLGGRGSFDKLLELIGWCYIPQIMASIVSFLAILFYSPEIQSTILEEANYTRRMELIRNITSSLPMSTGMAFSRIFGILMLIWFLYLSFLAVREEHEISDLKAAICIIIPTLIYLAVNTIVF